MQRNQNPSALKTYPAALYSDKVWRLIDLTCTAFHSWLASTPEELREQHQAGGTALETLEAELDDAERQALERERCDGGILRETFDDWARLATVEQIETIDFSREADR